MQPVKPMKDPDMSMFVAVVNGDLDAVRAALAAGADVSKDEEASRMTPLSWAVRMGHASCVDALLAAGADPWKGYGFSWAAVDCAMEHGRWDMLPALLSSGQSQDPQACSPARLNEVFKKAAWAGHLPSMKLFMDAGVRIDDPMPDPNPRAGFLGDANILARATYQRKEAAVRALLEAGADPSASYADGAAKGSAALMAVESGWPEGLAILIGAGADPDGPNGPGGLAKALAMKAGEPEHEAMLTLLEAAGADLTRPGLGVELLADACWSSNAEVIGWLCERGVDPAEPRADGPTPVEIAADYPGEPWAVMVEGYALRFRERRELEASSALAVAANPKRRM